MQRKTDRTFARRATVGIAVALLLLIALPATASAARIIKYRGELSTGDTVVASVLRRDNGRLFLRKLGFERLAFTCDEGDGDEVGISWMAYPGAGWTPTARSRSPRAATSWPAPCGRGTAKARWR